MAAGKLSRRELVKATATALALAVFGVYLMLPRDSFATGASAARWVLGLFISTTSTIALVFVLIRFRHQSRPRALEATDLNGEPATFLPRDRTGVVAGSLLSLTLTELLAGWAVIVFAGGTPGWGVVLILAALWFALPALWVLTGRWVAGGVWFTPTRVVHKGFGLHTWTAWHDITDVNVMDPKRIGVHSRQPGGRYLAPVMRNGKLLKDGRVTMNLTGLPLTDGQVLGLIYAYWRNPEVRAELGTHEGLDHLNEMYERA